MKKILIVMFSCLLLFNSQSMRADFVDVETAKVVAEKFLTSIENINEINLDLAHTEYLQGLAVYYVFDINNQGHIMIGADDRFYPVRAYIPNQVFSIEIIKNNPGPAWFAKRELRFFRDSIIINQTNRKLDSWKKLIHSTESTQKSGSTGPLMDHFNGLGHDAKIPAWGVGELGPPTSFFSESCATTALNSAINSGSCNGTCPDASLLGLSTNYANSICETGYPAVAIGEIMDWYKHPYKGEATSSHTTYFQSGNQLVGMMDFNVDHSIVYDWDNIGEDVCNTYFNVCHDGDQTSELLYHISVALETEYCAGQRYSWVPNSYSAGDIDKIPSMLEDHFGYDDDVVEKSRPWWQSDNGWEQELINELDAGRPFVYQGSGCHEIAPWEDNPQFPVNMTFLHNTFDKHAWICDGYMTTYPAQDKLFHFLWGNECGVFGNSWYSIRNANMNNDGNTSYNFNAPMPCGTNESIIKNIFPGTDLYNDASAPSYSYVGNTLDIDIRVRNDFGNGTESSAAHCNPFTVKFYASQNTTINPLWDTYLTSINASDMSGNSYQDLSVIIDPSAHGLIGDYYIGWVIDSENDVWERDNSNNTGYINSLFTFNCVDLVVTNNDFGFSNPGNIPVTINGTVINYTVEIENIASGPASTNFEVAYYLSADNNITQSDYFLESDNISALHGGGSILVNNSFDISDITYCDIPSGTYYIGVIIDNDNDIGECDETNNAEAFRHLYPSGPVYYQFTIQRGCMSTFAYNYNPNANLAYCTDTCDYFIQGCADPGASNFNANALIDDGTCSYCLPSDLSENTIAINSSGEVMYNISDDIFGFQFDITGVNINNAYGGDADSAGFTFTTGNSTGSSTILGFSMTGGVIPAGSGILVNLDLTSFTPATIDVDNITFINSVGGLISVYYSTSLFGCTDPNACNYDPSANCNDGTCIPTVYGCIDPLALNYNANATCDDGSCYSFIYGCTDSSAFNYNDYDGDGLANTYTGNPQLDVNTDDGSCIPIVYGCTNSLAINYNVNANTDDGTCIASIAGCMDSLASNYYSFVNVDDGSCIYAGCTDVSAANYDPISNTDDGSCLYTSAICPELSPTGLYASDLIQSRATINWNNMNSNTTPTSHYIYAGNYYYAPSMLNINVGDTVYWINNGGYHNVNFDISSVTGQSYDNPVSFITSPTNTELIASYVFDVVGTYNYDCSVGSHAVNGMVGAIQVYANTTCSVDQYRIKFRPVGTSSWSQKTMGGPVGSCNAGNQKTDKLLLSLLPSTDYEYKMKAWYCGGGSSAWTSLYYFTTANECPNVGNLTVTTPLPTRAAFTWDDSNGPYSFVRIKMRVDNIGHDWFNVGGAGVYWPLFSKNKNGLVPGESYRGQARAWCDPNGGAYKSPTWTSLIFWTQPNIRVEGGTSINNLDIYPNPSRDVFNITFTSETVQDLRVRVLNLIGEELIVDDLQQFVGEYTKQINLEENAKGIYFLEIETNDGIINKKLILQ